MPSKREKELEAIVRQMVPAARDVFWCALATLRGPTHQSET